MASTLASFRQILDGSHITNPYPLYAQLREEPVSIQEDGTYVVSTYKEVVSLLHDPRISSDMRKSAHGSLTGLEPSFLTKDPPDHDRLRHIVTSQFTPELIEGTRDAIQQIVRERLAAKKDAGQIDIVDDLAYPLPVSIICKLLGVPREDEPRFHQWVEILVRLLDPGQFATDEDRQMVKDAVKQMDEYLKELLASLREHPGNNLLSRIICQIEAGASMSERELLSTSRLLLIAGHETTVNLITNGMLTLLRQPALLEQVRQDPELAISFVEELLRYDPPVQFRIRTVLTDIEVAGVLIPKGATIVLLLASGSHDACRFAEPERFLIERDDNQHLGFGSGIHYCVGAPLARLEAQMVLTELSRRLIAPTLAMDPPPYRENAALRGPLHLLVHFAGLRD